MNGLDELLLKLKEKEYDRSKKQIVNVYKIPSEKRLQQANLQLKNSDDDPSRLVPYGVKRCSDNLYKFFHEYNFGHISEFALNDKGWIDTTIIIAVKVKRRAIKHSLKNSWKG